MSQGFLSGGVSLLFILKETKDMFGPTQKVVFTMVNDAPTEIASVTEETMLTGTISAITSVLSKDTAVIGIGRTLAFGLVPYAAAVFTNQKLTGKFRFNPLAAK